MRARASPADTDTNGQIQTCPGGMVRSPKIISIKAIEPEAKIVGSSGLTANGDVAKAIGAGIKHFVAKPYTAEALLRTLGKAFGKIPDE